MRRIVLAGGSGFLVRTLAHWFSERGDEVVILTRQIQPSFPWPQLAWDGANCGPWVAGLENSHAVINLAGRSVNCRYNTANRRAILESRTQSTAALGEAIRSCKNPPRCWLNSSTATIYRHRFDAANDEATGEIGSHPDAKDAFSVEVAKAWEEAFANQPTPTTRKVALRAAMVFGREPGGVFPVLLRLTRCGLGGPMDGGRQFVSWIHEVDFCRAVDWLIEHSASTGPYNLTSPNPLPNAEMMRELRRVVGMPAGLAQPRWLLELGAAMIRTETELIVKSRRVVPARLLSEGFTFVYPEFPSALRHLLNGEG